MQGDTNNTITHVPPIRLLSVEMPGLNYPLIHYTVAPLSKLRIKLIIDPNYLTEEPTFVMMSFENLKLNSLYV